MQFTYRFVNVLSSESAANYFGGETWRQPVVVPIQNVKTPRIYLLRRAKINQSSDSVRTSRRERNLEIQIWTIEYRYVD